MTTQLVPKFINGGDEKISNPGNFRVRARPKVISFTTQGFTMKAQRVSFEARFAKHIVTPGGTRNNGLNNRWVESFANGLDITSGNSLPSHQVRIGIVITLASNAKIILAEFTMLLVRSFKVRGYDTRGKMLAARIPA
jgi:hypothetical protein